MKPAHRNPPAPRMGAAPASPGVWTRPREALLLLIRGRTAGTALPVAAVVGTVLSLVNQGSTMFTGRATAATWIRVAVNYAVPFIVASVGYLAARRVPAVRPPWQDYLAGFHDTRSGITERLLAAATDRRHRQPYAWAVEPLGAAAGPVLDLACGSALTRALMPHARWLGVDVSAGELAAAAGAGRGPLVQCRAEQLPVRDHSIDAVCAAMCLPVITPLDAVLTEVTRVLRPGGTLVALVPARTPPLTGLPGWWRVLHALGLRSQPWPNPAARNGLPKILRAHGFTVDTTRRRTFWRSIDGPDAVALLVDGLYLPGVAPDRIPSARTGLARWARPGRRLPFPLLRVVAHTPSGPRPLSIVTSEVQKRESSAAPGGLPAQRPPGRTSKGRWSRMRAVWNGVVLAESPDTVRLEGNHYFPMQSVRRELLRPSQAHTVCPWKGTASYYDVIVDGQSNRDAAWYYPHPSPAASTIADHVAFWHGVHIEASAGESAGGWLSRVHRIIGR